MRPPVIAFDCDGVLLDSVELKTEAFSEWVPDRLAHLRNDFVAYHLSATGKSRAVQIRAFYEEIAKEEVSETYLDAEVRRFAALVSRRLESVQWRRGSADAVQYLRTLNIPLYVVTGAPQLEVEASLRANGALDWFVRIISTAREKASALREIAREVGCDSSEVWFVGDADADAAAALAVGARFFYFPSKARMSFAAPHRLNSLADLVPWLTHETP